jgi:hypothetical protein
MNKCVFRYPFRLRFFMKLGLVVFGAVFLIGFPYYLSVSVLNIFHHVPNPPDRLFLLLTLVCLFLGSLYITNSYPDIKIVDDGLQLNSSGIKFHVCWQDIQKVYRGKGYYFKVFLIETKTLTPFHRIYGLMYGNSNVPSFLIWSILPGHEKLLHEIKAHIK